MTHKYAELRAKMPPEDVALARQQSQLMRVAMDMQNLLNERGYTQEALARQLEIAQGNVSRMLRRTNMQVSTLQDVIEAMGGKLEITAHFPDADYRIDQFTTARGEAALPDEAEAQPAG